MSIWDVLGCVFWISLILYITLKNDGDSIDMNEWHGAGTLHDQINDH